MSEMTSEISQEAKSSFQLTSIMSGKTSQKSVAFELGLRDREDRSRYKWKGGKGILSRSLIKGKKAREYEMKLKAQEMKLD